MTVQEFGIQVRSAILDESPGSEVVVKTEGASEVLDVVKDGRLHQFPHADILKAEGVTVESAVAQILEAA